MASSKKSPPRQSSRRTKSVAATQTTAVELVTEFAHELRTPLSATLLWAKLLNTPTAPDPVLLREGLEAITTSAHEQQALIDQLVLVAQLLAGRVQLVRTTVAMAAFTRQVADPWQARARARNITFELSLDPNAGTGLVDAPRWELVLHNLLDNALRFTPRAGRVALELTREAHALVWRVTDTGPGIAALYQSHLFKLHPKKRPPADRSSTGLGVGLFIAHQLVTLHDGTLTVQSGDATPGTVFTARLPCAAPSGH